MNFGLILSEVGQGFRRNASMVISVVLVTFVSLTFFGAAILLQQQIQQMKGYWYDRAQVAVYFCTDLSVAKQCNDAEASQEQIDAVQQQLDSPTLKPYIKQYVFQNHQQEYDTFAQQFKGNALVGVVQPDYFNQTFRINMVDPNQADIVIQQVSGMPGVESVEDQRALLEPIFAVINVASFTAIGIAALMLIAGVLLIATTIRLSAFSRRRELGIMRLVGASNRFIETPFILEGVLAAFIGSVLASIAVLLLVQFFVQGYLAQMLPTTTFIGLDSAWIVVPVIILTGVVLAALSAGVAIRRYLKI